MSYRILTIDPGSTSTKIGVFDDEKMLFEENLHHSAEALAQFETIPQQEAFRRRLVLKALEEHHIPLESLSAVCGRGGVLKPVHGGTYLTTDAMIDTLKKGPYGHHASNLGGLLAREIGSALHIPSYIVDPPVVDELAPLARYSGHPLITRRSIFHALNQKAVAKRYAKEIGKPYESLNLIVCHMGGTSRARWWIPAMLWRARVPSPRSGPGRCPAAHWWICASAASIPSRRFAA